MKDMNETLKTLLDKKAESNNTIDLNAYAIGLEDGFNAEPWIKVSERLPEIKENNSRVALPMHVITTDGKLTIADYTRSRIDGNGSILTGISFDPIWICREQGCEMTNQQIQVELYQPLPTASKD